MAKMNELERIQYQLQKLEDMGFSSYRISKETGISEAAIGKLKKGQVKKPNDSTAKVIGKFFADQKNPLTRTLVKVPFVERSAQVIGDNEFVTVGNATVMIVPLIEQDDHETFIKQFQIQEFLNDFPKFSIVVDKYPKGKHFAFKVSGESMVDGTSESIPNGSVVVAREIQKSLWSKIHFSQFNYFVVVSKAGVMVKKVADLDQEGNTIQFSSLNPDKNKYPDVTLPKDEILMILHVVSFTVYN